MGWWSLALFRQCQTDIDLDREHLINHFDHWCSVFLTFLWQPFKVTNISLAQKYKSISWNVCKKPDTSCVFFLLSLYQQISTAGTSLGSLVGSHALCFLCRSVSWAELIPLMLLSPPFFADTHSQEIDHPGEPQEACISILLIATNTNTHTAAVFSPTDGLLSKQRLSRGATVTIKPFPDERKHPITAANIPFLELVANAMRIQHR